MALAADTPRFASRSLALPINSTLAQKLLVDLAGRIGPICLEAKQTGERSARKSACCVRRGGGWKRGMVEMV